MTPGSLANIPYNSHDGHGKIDAYLNSKLVEAQVRTHSYSLTSYSLTSYSLTYSLTSYSLTYLLTYSLTHLLTHLLLTHLLRTHLLIDEAC